MKKFILCSMLTLSLAATAFAQTDGDNPDRNAGPGGIKEGMTKLMLTDNSFVKKAAASNMAEIELSKLALRQSNNSEVKNFAKRMVQDHTKAGDELKALAMSKNIEVPTEVDHAHKKAAEKIGSMSGDDFNKAYGAQMQEDHDKTVALFTAAADDKSIDPKFREFAAKTLPVLRDHQQTAHGLPGADGHNSGKTAGQ